MKRLISIVLILCCVCCSALAQESTEALRVLDGWASREYASRYPDRRLETIKLSYDDLGKRDLRELLQSGQWDVAVVGTTEISLLELYNAGLLMDLATVPRLADRFHSMYPSLLKAVSKGEKRFALPVGMLFHQSMKLAMADTFVNSKGQEINVRENLGLTDEDVPKTFAQLCALAEKYMALPKQVRKGTVFDIDSAAGSARHYFLNYLIDIYAGQMADSSGNIDFDTPLFRESIEQLEVMAKALAKDAKISYGQGSSVYGLMRDTANTLIGEGMLCS